MLVSGSWLLVLGGLDGSTISLTDVTLAAPEKKEKGGDREIEKEKRKGEWRGGGRK